MTARMNRRDRRLRMVATSPSVMLGSTRVMDLLIILVVGWAAYWLRHGTPLPPVIYFSAIGLSMFFAANIFHFARLYRLETIRNVGGQLTRLLGSWVGVAMLLLVIGVFSKTSAEYSRIWLATWLVLAFFALGLFRIWLTWRVLAWQRSGLLQRNLVVVGVGNSARRLIRHVNDAGANSGVRLVGAFAVDSDETASEVEGLAVLGDLSDLLLYVRSNAVDEIVVAISWAREERIGGVLDRLREAPVDVSLAPEPLAYRLADRRVDDIGGLPLTVVQERPLSGWSYVIKGIEDRVLALLILIMIAPILLIIAIIIRLDSPGPALFRQQRYGFNNNVFTVYKFRSMRTDAGDTRGGKQATRGDPRITRIGAFIRKTSLDELPQLFNVLQGDMSLVGPRPHAVAHNEEYEGIIDQYLGRHKVKPGITGWAQIHGLRGETDTPDKMEMRVQYDLYYIDNWSLWLDIKILFRTLFVGFVNPNAY